MASLKDYRGRGATRSEVIRDANATVRLFVYFMQRPGRRHPYYWASFIQSGEWAPLDGTR